MDTPDLRRLFSACNGSKSGRIEYEDFTHVCKELNVPAGDIRTLFNKFDADGDGSINYDDFCSSFSEVSETLNLAMLGNSSESRTTAWDEFENSLDGDVAYYLGKLWDPLSKLYEQIHATSDILLLQQYENLIKALVMESRESRMESDNLETSLRRTEELASSQLAELEDDLNQQLSCTEQRIQEEAQKKMEGAIATFQRKHEIEMADLQAEVERLTKYQEEFELNSTRDVVVKLRNQIQEVTEEREEHRRSLLKAQMNISVLQVELDKLKNAYADEKLQHERESKDLKKMVIEYQSYAENIKILQDMNKKLYDSNDGLRSALAKDSIFDKRQHVPISHLSPTKLKPIRQSTVNHNSFANEEDEKAVVPPKEKFSLLARWADSYPDSGVSLHTDPNQMSGYSSDTDGSHNSEETVHHSYSYVPSDMEMSDLKSELNLSVAPSRVSSITSSLRRRLSAFPVKQFEVDTFGSDSSVPVYHLVLAGDAGSGKSSFLLRLCLNEFRGDMQTTLGVDFQMKQMLVDGEKTNLQIWDTAGQERFRCIARSYFRKAHGVLLLYDVTSENSFLNVREWMEQIQDSTGGHIPLCVIGNKVDLRTEETERSCVSYGHGEKLAMTYNALFCEASAKEGTNVVEAVLHLAREIKKHAKERQRSDPQLKLSLNSGKKALSNCCGV